MPITVDWHPDYDGTVVLMKLTGAISVEELLASIAQEGQFIEAVSHTVHTIIDMTRLETFGPNVLSNLPKIAQMPAVTQPNAGTKVAVGVQGFARTLMHIFSTVHRAIQMVETMDEAEAIITAILGGDQP